MKQSKTLDHNHHEQTSQSSLLNRVTLNLIYLINHIAYPNLTKT